jgi:hypothetical protein
MAKTKTKSGPKPKFGETMKFRVSIIVTEKQAKAIQNAAELSGESASTWLRKIALAAIPREVE